MGLGFFIAKTLIERIGGTVNFGNRPKARRDGPRGLPAQELREPSNFKRISAKTTLASNRRSPYIRAPAKLSRNSPWPYPPKDCRTKRF